MSREQWMWMRASVALVAAAATSLRASVAESAPALPQPIAAR